jgi:hypothetical protein
MAAPTWTKQVLENGARNYLATYTIFWGALDTGLPDAYTAADATDAGDMGVVILGQTLYPGPHLKIMRLGYDMSDGLGVRLTWDATTPQDAYIINGTGAGKQMFVPQGGLYVPQDTGAPIAGATGNIIFNTIGTGDAPGATGDFISINMWLRKDISQQ